MESELQTMINTDKEFSDLSKREGTAAAFFEFADEDAIMLPKNNDAIKGRVNIKEAMAGMGNAVLTWSPEDGTVSEAGDLGYTWGRFELSFADTNGMEQIRKGKYVSIWKKQIDGNWKWIVDIGNTDDPK